MAAILQEIMSILVAGITTLGEGIGTGLGATVKSIFLEGAGTTSDPYTLSVFGGIIVTFGGIALAVGLTKMVVGWVMSLGARK